MPFETLTTALRPLSRQTHSRTPTTQHVRALENAYTTRLHRLSRNEIKLLQKGVVTIATEKGTHYIVHGKSVEDPEPGIRRAKKALEGAGATLDALVSAYSREQLLKIEQGAKLLAEHPGAKTLHVATMEIFVPKEKPKTGEGVAAALEHWRRETQPKKWSARSITHLI